jgi:hypothetical protein
LVQVAAGPRFVERAPHMVITTPKVKDLGAEHPARLAAAAFPATAGLGHSSDEVSGTSSRAVKGCRGGGRTVVVQANCRTHRPIK